MSADTDLARRRAEAAAARTALVSSARELQTRLSAQALAGNVWDGVRDRGEEVAAKAVAAASARPVATSAAAVGLLALIARKPLGRLVGRLRGKD